MILRKKLSSEEVLEALAAMAAETIPEEMDGSLSLSYDDDGGVEIYFVEKGSEESLVS